LARSWRFLLLVEVLYASNNNTSTVLAKILSTKYGLVKVVEIVEVLLILNGRDKAIVKHILFSPLIQVMHIYKIIFE
jgi:hypothetical protein